MPSRMKTLLVLILSMGMVACASSPVITHQPVAVETISIGKDDSLVTCRHKYEQSRDVIYLRSNSTQKHYPEFNTTVYTITDINGRTVHISHPQETENYICTETKREP